MEIRPPKPILRVLSAVLANLSAAWLITLFITQDFPTLTANAAFVILSLYLAVKTEELLENYD